MAAVGAGIRDPKGPRRAPFRARTPATATRAGPHFRQNVGWLWLFDFCCSFRGRSAAADVLPHCSSSTYKEDAMVVFLLWISTSTLSSGVPRFFQLPSSSVWRK